MSTDPLRVFRGSRAPDAPRVVVVAPDELRALVLDAVREVMLSEHAANSTDEWLSSEEAADLLGVCMRIPPIVIAAIAAS